MFFLTSDCLERLQLDNETIGAVVTFEGKVRNHNEGKKVIALEYEAYESLALKEAKTIISEAKERYPIFDLIAAHRTGRLNVGDVTVVITVAAAHRQAAFLACRYMIDAIKQRLPIWKKEYYDDGSSAWIGCKKCSRDETRYYSRQQHVGIEGQRQLKGASVLVVGAGGLGCPALTYLAAAGVGQITICDSDTIEISNLHRQVLYTYDDIGREKASVAKQRLQNLNPFVTLSAVRERVAAHNVEHLLSGHDLVLDCTDNIATKFLLHDACHLHNIPLVLASIYQIEGMIQIFLHPNRGCLRCLWPTLPKEGDSCANVGVIGAVPGILGSMQAMEAIKVIRGIADEMTMLIDLTTYAVSKVHHKKNPQCPLCGIDPTIKTIEEHQHGWHLSHKDEHLLRECDWIDIRNSEERDNSLPWVKHLKHMPGNDTLPFHQLNRERRYVLVCQKGNRSSKLVEQLRQQGLTHFFSLLGGVAVLEAADSFSGAP